MRPRAFVPLILGACAVAGAAVMNRSLRAPPGSSTSRLGGTERCWRWRGFDMFAAEAGTGPLIVLVHGIYAGSSSFEYRRVFPLLARRHRVVAVDLLGCGRSERPDIDYTAELFVEQIVSAVAEFGPSAAAIVGSSLGGAFTIRATARMGGRIGAVAAICPTGLAGTLDRPATSAGKTVTRVFRSPLLGELLFNLLASRPSLRWFLEHQAYADASSATPEVIDDYWTATHQPGARFVPAHFVGGALNCDIAGDLPRIEVPVLIAWGERAEGPSPIEDAAAYVESARSAQLATFAHSRLLPHEEEPQLFAERLECFVAAARG